METVSLHLVNEDTNAAGRGVHKPLLQSEAFYWHKRDFSCLLASSKHMSQLVPSSIAALLKKKEKKMTEKKKRFSIEKKKTHHHAVSHLVFHMLIKYYLLCAL